MDAPPLDRRLRLLLISIAATIAAIVVIVTPYTLLFPDGGMIFPYIPPPLSALRPAREAMANLLPSMPLIALLGAGFLSLVAVWRLNRAGRPREAVRAAGLIAALGMAAAGQAAGHANEYALAGWFYLFAALSFAGWASLSREQLASAATPVGVSRRVERVALALVLLLTFVARFYELQRIPYGIEGDEAKWTAQVVDVMLEHRHVLASDWHYWAVPGSFYMQAPFHYLFGPSLLSARIAVGFYSVLASLVFYALTRALFNAPAALLATGFMSVSILDISASRQALVESHTKLWVIAGPALLILALRHRRSWLFALAGAAFGLGIVTYDTYLPILGVGGAIFLIEMLFILRAEPAARDWRAWLIRWAAFLAALAPLLGRAWLYIGGRGHDYRLEDVGWATRPVETFLNGLGRVLRVFFEQVDRDFFHTRPGPLINGLLVPLLVLGVIGCLALWRRQGGRVSLVWAALTLFPAPIVLQLTYPRVLYTALPALYILAALGAFWVIQSLWAWAGRQGRRALLAFLCVCVIAYPTLNLYIYFNEVHESANDKAYRELSDFLVHFADEDRLIFIPYLPLRGDLAEQARPWFDFYMRQNYAPGTQGRYYQIVRYPDLFVAMTQAFEQYTSIGVLIDRNVLEPQLRQALVENIRGCFRAQAVWPREYADFLLFWSEDQRNAPCYSARITLTPEETLPAYSIDSPPLLYWSVSNGAPLQAALECQRQRSDIFILEVEDFEESQFYSFKDDIVDGFSGRGVIADDPGDAPPLVATTYELPRDDTYTVWARAYRVRDDGFPLYLTVDDYPVPLPFSVNPPINAWHWERLGDFELTAGEVYFAVTRPYEGEKPFAIYIDTLLLTTDQTYEPEDLDARWETVLPGEPVDLPAPGVQQGVFSMAEHWGEGIYRCRAGVWDGKRLRDSEGNVGVWSGWVEMMVVEPETES